MINSSSKFHSRKFLKHLRENNYIGPSGKEYCKFEIDQEYFQKCSDLAVKESEKAFKNYFKKHSKKES